MGFNRCKLCALLMLFFLSCGSSGSNRKFFDVPGYMRNEITMLSLGEKTLSKTSCYNETRSVQVLSCKTFNWEKEFAIFLESDINRPIYIANLKTDHYRDSNSSSVTKYYSVKENLSIQEVRIDTTGNEPTFVSVHVIKKNLLSTTDINAFYIRNLRYGIIGVQTIKGLNEENKFWIDGQLNE